MAVRVDVVYEGGLHCVAKHEPSGHAIPTDAPADNHGKGEAFSPTDLLAAAIGTCTVTIMGIAAEKHGIDIAGTRVTVLKSMVADPARRIGKLDVTITLPRALPAEQRTLLENAARTCPIHKSLHPNVEAPVTFVYPKP